MKKHSRWHCFDLDGKKIIKRFPIGVTPGEPWLPGTGPHSPEAREKIIKHLKENVHKPKSEETKQKMREAKLGKKFTQEHKDNLRKAQQRLRDEKRERIEEAYKLAQQFAIEYYQEASR
jgi:hypothetical protein